jgi:hypothetical protein
VTAGLLVAVFAAGCGSGHGNSPPPDPVINLNALDVGPYDPTPRDMGRPKNDYQAKDIEAERLGDTVPLASDIDPSLIYGGNANAIVFEDPKETMLHNFESAGSDRAEFINSTEWPSQSEQNATAIDMSVMQFPDADTAKRAAGDFYDTDFNIDNGQSQPVPLSKYPDAHAQWRPGTPVVRSFLAHGSYVVAVVAFTPTADLANLTTLSQQAYTTEFPLLDQLPPISDEDTMNLSWDPDYMVSRTLNSSQIGAMAISDTNAVFGPRGILHYLPDRAFAKKSFTAMKADKFAHR